MPIPSSSSDIKGVAEIRTRTGQMVNSGIPYIAYLKLSCLEMEKARRQKEKRSAETRIANINARLEEIEAEKDAILRSQGERDVASRPVPARRKRPADRVPGLGCAPDGCFKIKY